MEQAIAEPQTDKEIHANSTENASTSIQVAGSRTSGGRPIPSPELEEWTRRMWEETEKPENWEAAVNAAEYCKQTLFPGWYDPRDPAKGRMHVPLRQRKDDRRVRNPITYINLQQSLAMLMPEGTRATTEPDNGIDSEALDGNPVEVSPTLLRFARSLDAVSKVYTDEAKWPKIRKLWVRDAIAFPIAWLKIFFSRSWADGPIGRSDSGDEQGNMARIAAISQQILDGEIYQGDAQWIELQQLMEGIGGKSELVLNQELVIERLSMEDVVTPDSTIKTEDILRSPWIAHNMPTMTVGELRKRYPYAWNEADGTWTGIHPDDLKSLSSKDPTAGTSAANSIKRNPHTNNQSAANGDKRPVRVREIHSREDNSISVLIEGLSYPAHRWTPKKTPMQWYMFCPLVLNEVPGSMFGFSHTEMASESQHRINRKLSDAEKNRWLAMTRFVRDTSIGDPKDQLTNLADTAPGSSIGMNLGGKDINTQLFPVSMPYNAEAYDIQQDEKYGRMANRLPEQAMGATGGGGADFSSEVDLAAQGATIAIKDIQGTIKEAAAGAERLIREILMLELSWHDAAEVTNPNVVWPHVYSEQEAKALYEGICSEARMQVAPQVMQAYQQDPMLFVGASAGERTSEVLEAIERVAAPMVEDACMERFGFPEPMSREALFKRLKCTISYSMNADMDRQRKQQQMAAGLTAIAEVTQALAAAGKPVNHRVLARAVLPADAAELHDIFPDDPNAAIRTAAQLIQQDPAKVDMALLQQVAQLVAQLLMQQGTAPGAPPGQPTGPGGAPPPPSAASAPQPTTAPAA